MLKELLTVTVCVNYSDILESIVRANKRLLYNWWIITSSYDLETIDLCKKYGINYYITNSFYKDSSPFNKAAALNDFFDSASYNNINWILLLDADILLYDIDLTQIKSIHNNDNKLFGCKRKIFNSKHDLITNNGYIDSHYVSFVGYFHLFHINNIMKDINNKQNIFNEYPTASEYDNDFRDKYWPNREQRILLNGLTYHLGPKELHWEGRKELSWEANND